MRRIRFHYDDGTVGGSGHADTLVEDDATDKELERDAEDTALLYLPERGWYWEEIADDDEDWEGE